VRGLRAGAKAEPDVSFGFIGTRPSWLWYASVARHRTLLDVAWPCTVMRPFLAVEPADPHPGKLAVLSLGLLADRLIGDHLDLDSDIDKELV
jgi:hypothetical protein